LEYTKQLFKKEKRIDYKLFGNANRKGIEKELESNKETELNKLRSEENLMQG